MIESLSLKNAFCLVIPFFLGIPGVGFATIKLPAVLGSNMVLQQRSNVKLWGWSAPGEKVFIQTSWNGKIDSTVATRDANWQLIVNTPGAGGPYTISFEGQNKLMLSNVMIGEVWVCSGQSNMEWGYQQGLKDIKNELAVGSNKNIRMFNIPKTTSEYPQDDCRSEWVECDSNSLNFFSAIGYFFAKNLQNKLGIAIGVINASWGGTPAEVWTPAPEVMQDSVLVNAARQLQPAPWWPYTPGVAYNGMIAPITR